MKVSVLAQTTVSAGTMWDAYGYDMRPEESSGADGLAEAAGRTCYKAFGRKNPSTAHNAGYLDNIISQGHFSVLEHASVTFLVRGVSRALLAELSRHRHLSFSVVSQRYVNYANTDPVIPPAIRTAEPDCEDDVHRAYDYAVEIYESLVIRLMDQGLNRKQAREAARAVLPNAAPVDMVVTGNLRAWRDVLGKRHHVSADAEIQVFAHKVLSHLRNIAPNSVQDIPSEPYGSQQ